MYKPLAADSELWYRGAMKKISYSSAGVNIDTADQAKKRMADDLKTDNPLVLNKVGAFASLCDGAFPGYEHPVLVCKTEEPGSKQVLAFQHKRLKGICEDMINHLVNDIIVMGAKPVFVQDLIVCGKLEKDVVGELVRHLAAACKAQDCVLTGGETSEQPAVLPAGTYVLGSSCIGVAEKSKIVDGSTIKEGDIALALESSGLHTNGYTLVRALIKEDPAIIDTDCGGRSFLDAILEPHRCYYHALKGLFGDPALHGMAHITGGGIPGNLNRILPEGIDAVIDAGALRIPAVFKTVRERSGNDDADMTKTFNLGAGSVIVVAAKEADRITKHVEAAGVPCYPIGVMKNGGTQTVRMEGALSW